MTRRLGDKEMGKQGGEEIPRLTKEDVLACLEYASYLAIEKVVPV